MGTRIMAEVQKTRFGIVFGGRSGEHEVSLKSAASVIETLDPEEFEISVIGITKSGKFATASELRGMLPSPLLSRVHCCAPSESGNSGARILSSLVDKSQDSAEPPDVIFPLLHGPYGEDGTVQGLLEIAGLPYVGCGVLASAAGMDKDIMKRLFLQAGLPVPPFRTVLASEIENNLDSVRKSVSEELGYPLFSKPANLGSSVGVRKIRTTEEFDSAVKHSAQFDRKILIEKGINARELECAILGNEDSRASVVGEVLSAHEFYDYDAKYKNPESRLEIPARIDGRQAAEIRMLALRSFKAIDGSGLSRVDFFLDRDSGKIWINEINTMPGFTPISMYTKLWAASGLPFDQLVRRLIELGMERFQERNGHKTTAR
jgi:D-alanine-D-alanine ligase